MDDIEKPEDAAKKAQILIDLGFGGLFKGLTDMVGELSDAVEKLNVEGDEKTGEFTVKGLGDDAKGVFGFSIKTATGGGSRVEPFGNIRQTEKGPEVADTREPLVDVFDEPEEIIITAELPGVAEEQIDIALEDDILSLHATGTRKYAKEILLSSPVDAASLAHTYNNGILEIRLTKADAAS